jgi:Mg-chelatase subunit ChlD
MGLVFKTSKWADRLWTEHLELSEGGRDLVKRGIGKQGETFAGFPADLHARLYLPTEPTENDDYPEWAGKLHAMSTELQEWHQLKLMTSRNGFASGIAAEVMLEQLLPHVPDPPEAEPEDGAGNGKQKGDEQTPCPSDSDIRTALRKATRNARDAVQDAESAIEGMAPGIGVSRNNGPADLKAIRDAHAKLKDSPRLKRIAQLAGRFERIASSKARSKVKPGVGEIHGVGLGDDISRLLPSELVQLKHPKLKLAFMARLLERKALTYAMQGREPQGRGPIVVLLDESGSMRADGRDNWSKAVCLTLLSTATKQKRPWHLVAFNGAIIREVAIEPGKGTAADIQRALDHRCRGGTDFNAPITRACEIIQTSKTMKQADVVLITDGEDELEDGTVEAATMLTKNEGVSWFVVGVGQEATQTVPITLGPIATSMHCVARIDDTSVVADLVNLERKEVA